MRPTCYKFEQATAGFPALRCDSFNFFKKAVPS